MLWSEVKRWAKNQGYDVVKEKDDSENGATYYWMKSDDHNISGVAPSVSKVAKAIFNNLTSDIWTEHQTKYTEDKEYKQFNISDYN